MKEPWIPRLIGVIHLPPLSGSPRALREGLSPSDALQRAGLWAVKEARLLAQAGFEGLVIENFGDTPFYKTQVPPETVACLSVIAAAVREASRLPLGINILRNDARAALAVAAVTGSSFLRVNVLSGVVASDQGLIEGDAAGLLRERERLGVSGSVGILADVHVKHAQTLSSVDIGLAVEEVALRAMADGVVVTGATTGRSVDPQALERVARVAREQGVLVWIGSGSTTETLPELLKFAHGVLVGSSIRRGGRAGEPLDPKRARDFARAFRQAGKRRKAIRKKKTTRRAAG